MKHKSRLLKVGCILLGTILLALAGCATNRPLVSGIRGGTFMGTSVTADRVYVICSFPIEYRKQIVEPLAARLKTSFAEKQIAADVEVQFLNPIALDSGVSFRRAAMHKPAAIMLVRMGESSSGSQGGYWNINFDFLDSTGKGVWRGWYSIYRLDLPEETTERLARDLVRAVIEAGAIKLPEGKSV